MSTKLWIDEDRNFRLEHTYDIGEAMRIAKETSELSDGGRSKDGTMRCMGYIPPEEWNYDMHLIAAKHARNNGDMGEYVKNVKKFFEFNPQFSVEYRKRFF